MTHEHVECFHEECVEKGYEGAMLRWGDEPYRQGYRSQSLLKVKAFEDAEFKILDVVCGVGKMSIQGVFVCITRDGREFSVKPKGTDSLREQYLSNKEEYIGKQLIVKYFGMTDSVPPVPRFPIGIAVRDFE